MQTASLVGMEMGYEAKIHITEALNFTGRVPDFHKLVTELSVHENVLVVGHNPNLQQFLASLIAVAPSNAGGKTDLADISACAKARSPGSIAPGVPEPCSGCSIRECCRTLYSSVTKSSRRKTSKK